MSDESPTPPATAAPAKDASADVTSAPADAAAGTPERRPFWVGLDQPFAVGFAVTLGGLAAILLGLAVSNLATVIIYVSFALFAALGLDPIVRALERKGAIRVIRGTSRGIRLPAQEADSGAANESPQEASPSQGLPIIGEVAAGSPILAAEHIDRYCPLPPDYFTPRADYLLRARTLGTAF